MVRSTSASPDAGINVSVAVLGGEVVPLFLPEGSTVEAALTAAGMDTSSTVKCQGAEVSLGDICQEGDRLFITTKVKGG